MTDAKSSSWVPMDLPSNLNSIAWCTQCGPYILTMVHHNTEGWTASWSTPGEAGPCTSRCHIGPYLSREEVIEELSARFQGVPQ